MVRTTIIIGIFAAAIGLAQEKTTPHHRVLHSSNILLASAKVSQAGSLPHTYSAKEVRVLGDLDYGQASAPVAYSATPTYRAFVFSAFGGETVEVSVHGATRKAMVALADSGLNQLAIGDTSLRLSLPNRGPYIECWYIVFRDFEKKPAQFTVQVNKLATPPAAPQMPVQTASAEIASTK